MSESQSELLFQYDKLSCAQSWHPCEEESKKRYSRSTFLQLKLADILLGKAPANRNRTHRCVKGHSSYSHEGVQGCFVMAGRVCLKRSRLYLEDSLGSVGPLMWINLQAVATGLRTAAQAEPSGGQCLPPQQGPVNGPARGSSEPGTPPTMAVQPLHSQQLMQLPIHWELMSA